MPISIRCLEGPHQGKQIVLAGGKPLQLEVRKAGGSAGMLAFAVSHQGLMFTNSSPIDSQVNGALRRHAVLGNGDQIRVGRMLFEACLEGDLGELDVSGDGKDETAPNLEALDDDASRGDGKQSTEAYSRDAPVAPDDPTPAAGSRSSRRISASRMAAVDLPPPQREGLFSKVGKVFKRRDEGDELLNRLEDERSQLLQLAGRLALQRQGGFGLPGDLLQRLGAGQRVELGGDDLAAAERDSFRRHGELLAALDAEITARRDELGLGPDPSIAALRNLPLQTETAERRERAFKAMDSINTDEVQVTTTMMQDAVEDDDLEVSAIELAGAAQQADPTPPGGSGRRRPPVRRRRR